MCNLETRIAVNSTFMVEIQHNQKVPVNVKGHKT
jgi:hypothetical protein